MAMHNVCMPRWVIACVPIGLFRKTQVQNPPVCKHRSAIRCKGAHSNRCVLGSYVQ